MEIRGRGLRVWYGTPDAPAPARTVGAGTPVTLTMGVSPSHPANTAEVRYRVNDGPRLSLRARPLRRDPKGGKDYFHLTFPFLPADSSVEYGPVVQCAGNRAGVTPSGPLPSSFLVAPAPVRPAADPVPDEYATAHQFPRSMEFFGRARVQLAAQPEVIGDTPDGLHLNFPLAGGSVLGPKLNGSISHNGGDWMRVRTDGVGIPNIRATLETTDGALIMVHSSGRFELGLDGYANASKGVFPPTPALVLSIDFLTSHSVYNWLNRTQCIGVGYVKMAELSVHYDVYGVMSLSKQAV